MFASLLVAMYFTQTAMNSQNLRTEEYKVKLKGISQLASQHRVFLLARACRVSSTLLSQLYRQGPEDITSKPITSKMQNSN